MRGMTIPGQPPFERDPYPSSSVPVVPGRPAVPPPMLSAPVRTGRPWLVPVIAGLSVLAIAGGVIAYVATQNGADRRAAKAPAVPAAPVASAPSAPVSAVPSPPAVAGKALGTAVTIVIEDATSDITVFGWRQPSASTAEPPSQGYEWGSADVRICVQRSQSEITISWQPWAVTYSDGAVIEASNITYRQFPQPEYPQDRLVPVGRCVRGWITFGVPVGHKPQFVEYQPRGGGVTDWLV